MKLLHKLSSIWNGCSTPFIIHEGRSVYFADVLEDPEIDLSTIKNGDVVAVIGDFTPTTIRTILCLIDKGAIIVPLTTHTKSDHEYFFESALVDVVINGDDISHRHHSNTNDLIDFLRLNGHAGLILFSTGTTGRPKAILHDLTLFLKRFDTPRPTFRTINFLLFDHIGGINTLFHTLFNKGVIIAPDVRTVESILDSCQKYDVQVLPATPTFLRMMLMSGLIPKCVPSSLKVITYGTERMDQATLSQLCKLLPDVDFRQTFGMSELGIVRVKSEARNSLYMKIGGEGVETKVIDSCLYIRSESRMLGYLNAPSPFDPDGWYNTKDIVEIKGDYFRVIGRDSDVINVGGLKFMASDVERIALDFPGVSLVKVVSKQNPITGQHVELCVEPSLGVDFDKEQFTYHLKSNLQPHMVPRRVLIGRVQVGHRFKKS